MIWKILAVLLILAGPVFAEDLYVAQSTAGADNGSACANAKSMSWLNTAGSWGVGADKVSAGDTVHLCGTLTTALTIQGSGSAGSPITILFETGAKFSAATWTTLQGIISATSKDYIIIDGGTNGLIEATDNGTSKTYQNMPRGILINACSNWEIKNLSIHDLYIYETPDTTDDGCAGIYVDITSGNSNNLSIHDNSFTWMSTAVQRYIRNGIHDMLMFNNTIRYCNAGLIMGDAQASTWQNLSIYNNDFSDPNVWDDPVGNKFHHEFVHLWHSVSGSNATGVRIYSNYLHGNWGTYSTAGIYFEGWAWTDVLVYNNIFRIGHRSIYFKADGIFIVANNTFYPTSALVNTIDTAVWSAATNTILFKNNIQYLSAGPSCNGSTYNYGDSGNCCDTDEPPNCTDFTQATNLTGVDPVFVSSSDFHLQVSSPAIGQGENLSATFTTDYAGLTRQASPTLWDIGAYGYNLGGADTTAPTVTAFTIPATSTSLTVAISTFTTTDNVAVAEYCVNESATPPSAGTCAGSGWNATKQTSFVFGTAGAKDLYAWAKDTSDNISDVITPAQVTITLPQARMGMRN